MVERCTGIAEVKGRIPYKPEFFSGFLFATTKVAYRIYSINRPGRLLKFWTLRVGAYSRWALIRGGRLFEAGRLLNFHHFKQVKYV